MQTCDRANEKPSGHYKVCESGVGGKSADPISGLREDSRNAPSVRIRSMRPSEYFSSIGCLQASEDQMRMRH